MKDMNEKIYFLELLNKVYDDNISPDEMRILNKLIKTDDEAADLYAEFFNIVSGLVDLNKIELSFNDGDSTGFDLWISLLAQDEESAPAVEIPKSEELIHVEEILQKDKKFNLSIIFSVAALLFIVLFIYVVPQVSTSIEVATLTDSLRAKWSDTNGSKQNGTRFLDDGTSLLLQKGLAELQFDTGVRIVIEGPAEFRILAGDRVGLHYGKVYATVPQEAIGFSVYTQNAKIIDMGTEFGVQTDINGDTYLHVIKGRTTLIAGGKSNKVSMEVGRGVAKKVSAAISEVSDIPCDTKLFARVFDSKNNIVWRQHPVVDLADVVRGGNGLGTGNSIVRLDPIKGFTNDWHGGFSTAKGFLTISESAFVDGIFIPDGHTKQIVSSLGDVFDECPKTSGIFDMDLLANPKSGIFKTDLREGTIQFNGQDYTEESGYSCIVMHANHGLTFDLDAVRQKYKRSIVRFVSQVGIADLKEDCPCNADFWVLADGEVRYSLQQYKQKGVLNDVSVEIQDSDRFLTLVTTDGGDPDNPGDFYTRAISCDWCVFTEPMLEFE